MKITSKIILTGFSLCLGATLFMSLTPMLDAGPWVAPKTADASANPLKDDAQALAEGKKLYGQLCAVCHGDKGKGDGIAAAGLNPKPADHTSDKVQSQTDGAIFWKLTTGTPPMASYEKQLTEHQRWALVSYMRTLKKAAKK